MEQDDALRQKTAIRANQDIGYKLKSGSMSFLTRKLYNALVFHGQRLGVAQKGVLPCSVSWDIEANGIDPSLYFWLPLSELSADSACGNDYSTIKLWLQRMQTVLVSRGSAGAWQSEQIVGGIAMINTASPTPKARDGRWLIGWSFPPGLERHLLDPEQYTTISLYYQSQLTSESALALYEIVRRYATSPYQRTFKESWEDWQARIVTDSTPRKEYRFFKRDFLTPAIDQINSKTDVEVVLHEDRKGCRAVQDLMFLVSLKKQGSLELSNGSVFPSDLIDAMVSAGLSLEKAEQMLSEFGEERCRSNLDLYLANLGKKATGTGWLIAAIKDDYASGERSKLVGMQKKIAKADQDYAATVEASGASITNQIPEIKLEGAELSTAWCEFIASPMGKSFKTIASTYADAETKAQKAFAGWLSLKKTGAAIDDTFSRLWAVYPRQTNRMKAQKAYDATFPAGASKAEVDAILASIQRWKASAQWNKESGRYVHGFDRFLLEGIWNESPPLAQGAERPISEEFRLQRDTSDQSDARNVFRKAKTF